MAVIMKSGLYYLQAYNGDVYDTTITTGSGNPSATTPTLVGADGNTATLDAIALDSADGVYFIAAQTGNNNNILSFSIYEERFGTAPTFTTPITTFTAPAYLDQAHTTSWNIGVSIALDPADDILYYTDGVKFNEAKFSGPGYTGSASTVTLATLPKPSGDLVFDATDHTAYFAAQTGTQSITIGGATAGSVNTNYIYKVSGVTKNATSATLAATTHISPQTQGDVTGLAYDSANDTVYFVTRPDSFNAHDNTAGIYSLSSSGTVSAVHTSAFTSVDAALAHLNYIAVDPLTGEYYVADQQVGPNGAGIYAGAIGSTAAPTLVVTIGNVGGETPVPEGLAIDDPPTASAATVQSIDGNTAVTTGEATPADTVYIAVTFTEAVQASGGPTLTLNDGGTATYFSGSGTAKLVFAYTPATGQNTRALAVTGQAGGTITDLAGTPAVTLGVNATFSGLSVDTTPPTLAVAGTTTQAVQGGTSLTLLTAAPTITDPNGDGVLTAATVKIASGLQSGDTLGIAGASTGSQTFGDSDHVTWSYTSASGTLGIAGSATTADYASLLQTVTYQDSGNDTSTGSHPTRGLTFTINEGTALTSTAQAVTVTIDRAPKVATGGATASTTEGGTANGAALTGNTDPDGDTLSVSAISGGAVGSAVTGSYGSLTLGATGSYTYTASNTAAIGAAATGSPPVDSFTFTVADGKGGTTPETLAITIHRPPAITGGGATASTTTGHTVTGAAGAALVGDTDPDGYALSVSAVSGGTPGSAVAGSYGALTLNADGSFSYAATNTAAINAAATGAPPVDTFGYTVSDGHGGTAAESLAVTIHRAPAVGAVTATTTTGNTASGATGAALAGDTDPDGYTLSVSAISGGALGSAVAGSYGALTLNADGSYSYAASNTAAINAAPGGAPPVESFSYTVSDWHGGTATETLAVTINRQIAVPAGGATAATTAGGTTTGAALAGDSDPDGFPLSVSAIGGGAVGSPLAGAYGSLTLNANGSYSYTAGNTAAIAAAPSGSAPVDTFSFTVSDGHVTAPEALAVTINRPLTLADTGAAATYTGTPVAVDPTLSLQDIDGAPIASASASITGIVAGDVLTATNAGTSITTAYNGTTGVLSLSGSDTAAHYQAVLDSVTFARSGGVATGSTRTVAFTVNDVAGSSNAQDATVNVVACYAQGTLIATEGGEEAVEALRAGDRVLCAGGAARAIRWIGRRSYAGRFLAANPAAQPIRFSAGSLGAGLPRRDLLVSPEHAMFLDGVLVPARCLVNGGSIRQERGLHRVDYVHVELDAHDVVLAEGAASESYYDDGNRAMFHNAAEAPARHPDAAAGYCAPRIEQGPALEAIRRRLALISARLVHAA